MKGEDCIMIIDIFLIIALPIIHFVFYFFIEETDFNNILETFSSTPLFDFEINNNCGSKDNIIFHRWEGRKETTYYWSDGYYYSRTDVVDPTDITLINGNQFCYDKKMTYLELLNNDQIIKKGESCKEDYKNCGTIDTLEQELCIKNNEKCPLYDIRIEPNYEIINSGNYKTDISGNSHIYYNNENYNAINKKIIGKLLLNDGQPCYNLNEQLWRKFNDDEAGDEHLECELEIFGKKTDERYEKVGEISYKKIYDNNLKDGKSRDLFNGIGESKKLSLYKREFLGVDKECNDKSDLLWKNYDKLKTSQKNEKKLLLAESIIFFSCFVISCGIIFKSESGNGECFTIFVGLILILSFISCIICSSVFLGRMVRYTDLLYECSDPITNEVLKKNNSNTNKQIVFTSINLGIDILFIIFNVIAYNYEKIADFFKYSLCSCNCNCVCPCKKKSKYAVSACNQKINNVYNINRNPTNLDAPEGPTPYKEVIVNQNLPNPSVPYNKPVDNNSPSIVKDQGVPNPVQYPSLEEINKQNAQL